jgi:hypothetical protein
MTVADLQRLSDERLELHLDVAIERVQNAFRMLDAAQADRQALYDERERRDAERGITRPGAPCRTCGACHRCYLGDHSDCHGCRCTCTQEDHPVHGVRCDHGPTAGSSDYQPSAPNAENAGYASTGGGHDE